MVRAARRLLLLSALLAAGCRTVAPPAPPAPRSDGPPLDVRVDVFTVPDNAGPEWETPRRLFPVELAAAMRGDPQWSRVRVGPSNGPASTAEVEVSGRLLSNAISTTRVRLTARDATGREWFDRVYAGAARTQLWAQAAADLALAARALAPDERARLAPLAALRFASALSPERFAGHAERDEAGHWSIARMPAEDDPLWVRAQRILSREALLADAVDERHRLHAEQAGPLHARFLEFAAREEAKRREIEGSAWSAPFRMLGGELLNGLSVFTDAAAAEGGALARATTRLEKAGDALSSADDRELHQLQLGLKASRQLLTSEAEPFRLELDDAVHELTGSAEQQYEQLRDILRRMFEQETK